MQSSDRPHQNDNFDLLRLIAALMVLWSHQHVLLGFPEPVVSAIEGSLGTLGVCIFFGISGYLNALSLLRRRSAGSFLIGRALRIYPALIACIAFCVILGAFVTTDSANYYGLKTLKFFVQNSTLLGTEVRLPGVFKSNIYPEAVNGSIWTLPIEVTLYIGFALLALITKFKIRMILLALGIAALVLWVFSLLVRDISTDFVVTHDHFARFYGAVFLGGALLALAEKKFSFRRGVLVLGAVSAVFALTGQRLTALLVFIPSAVVFVGNLPSPKWLQPPIDISYGTYLYAFPVQQLVAGYYLPFWLSLGISLTVTIMLSLLSAVLIEQPALKLRKSRDSTSVLVNTAALVAPNQKS